MAKKQHILASLRKAEQNIFVPSGLARGFLKSFLNSTTNQTFVKLPDDKYQTLSAKVGMSFWEKPDDNHTIVRLATSWATTEEDVDALLALM